MSGPVGNARRAVAARVIVVLVLVALAAEFVVGGRAAARTAFDAGLAAHEAGDCATALARYVEARDTRFAPSSVQEQAGGNAEQCADYLEAEEEAEAGTPLGAVMAYDEYLSAHPDSLLEQRATDARSAALETAADRALAAADEALVQDQDEAGHYREAIDLYLDVPDDYPGTPAAARVPQALSAAYDRAAALVAEQRWCAAADALEVFADASEPELAESAGRAAAALPQPLYECGLQRFAGGEPEAARTYLRRLSDTYPADPLTAQARPTLIRAEVAVIAAESVGEVPALAPVGQAPGGAVTVEVVNDSPDEIEVLFAGPEADAVTIPACTECSAYFLDPSIVGGCQAPSLPKVSVDLAPGSYELGVRSMSGDGVVPYSGSWELAPGTAYSSCFFIVSSFG